MGGGWLIGVFSGISTGLNRNVNLFECKHALHNMESREDNNKSVLQCLYWWLLCCSNIYRLYQNKELKYVHFILGATTGRQKGCPRPVNGDGRQKELLFAVFYWQQLQNVDNWPLNNGVAASVPGGCFIGSTVRRSVERFVTKFAFDLSFWSKPTLMS